MQNPAHPVGGFFRFNLSQLYEGGGNADLGSVALNRYFIATSGADAVTLQLAIPEPRSAFLMAIGALALLASAPCVRTVARFHLQAWSGSGNRTYGFRFAFLWLLLY